MGGSYTKPKEVKPQHYEKAVKDLPSMSGKVVVVTGTTTGTGFIFAKTCMQKDATVVVLNRSSERVETANQDIQSAAAGSGKLVSVACDLQSFKSVREAAAQITQQFQETGVDVLCNNAGIMATDDVATEDGCDNQMQTNHLSHFVLTKELWPLLQKAADAKGESRVVNHSSVARFGPPLQAQYLGKNGGNLGGNKVTGTFQGPKWDRYHHSKLANLVFTYALRDLTTQAGSKVKALCAHPGYAATHLQVKAVADKSMSAATQNMAGATVVQAPEDGALGIIMCSCKADVENGQFFGPTGMGGMCGMAVVLPSEKEEKLADEPSRKMLWEESEKSTGTTFAVN